MIFLGSYSCWNSWFAFVSLRWPTIAGRLISGGVYTAPGFPATYDVRIRYEYSVGGVTYESERIRFGGINPFSYQSAASELAKLMESGRLVVRYDPDRPGRSCLIAGWNEWTLTAPLFLFIFGVTIIGVGVYGFA